MGCRDVGYEGDHRRLVAQWAAEERGADSVNVNDRTTSDDATFASELDRLEAAPEVIIGRCGNCDAVTDELPCLHCDGVDPT